MNPVYTPPPLITLTTDFGTRDAYVGSMKGVILGIQRNASIIDITHDLPAHRILPAAFLLREACPRFPEGTCHVAVIDPGVGGERRPVILEIRNRFYIGPDNGIFSLLLAAFGLDRGWRIDTPAVVPPAGRSRTFHGRDLFAPAAAHLASGVPPTSLGREIHDPLVQDFPASTVHADRLQGEVLWIDRFGNGLTNIEASTIRGWARGDAFRVRVAGRTLPGLSPQYGAVPPGEPLAIISSFGTLEIACNQRPADRLLGIDDGTPVVLERLPARASAGR